MFFQHFKIVIHQSKKGDHFGDSHPYWPFHVQTHPHELRSNSNYVWSLKAWACSTKQNNRNIIISYIGISGQSQRIGQRLVKVRKLWANKHSGGPWRSRGCYKRSPTLVLRPSPVPHLWCMVHQTSCHAQVSGGTGRVQRRPGRHDAGGAWWYGGRSLGI